MCLLQFAMIEEKAIDPYRSSFRSKTRALAHAAAVLESDYGDSAFLISCGSCALYQMVFKLRRLAHSLENVLATTVMSDCFYNNPTLESFLTKLTLFISQNLWRMVKENKVPRKKLWLKFPLVSPQSCSLLTMGSPFTASKTKYSR